MYHEYQKVGIFFLVPASTVTSIASLVVSAESLSALLEIATNDDDVDEDNGSITVQIVAGQGYEIHDTNSQVVIEVQDNDDTTPTITIADATAVVEGTDANAVFVLMTSHAVRDTRLINLAVSGATSFIQSDQIPTSVTLTTYNLRTSLSIPIHDDAVDEADGQITVTILAPTNTR